RGELGIRRRDARPGQPGPGPSLRCGDVLNRQVDVNAVRFDTVEPRQVWVVIRIEVTVLEVSEGRRSQCRQMGSLDLGDRLRNSWLGRVERDRPACGGANPAALAGKSNGSGKSSRETDANNSTAGKVHERSIAMRFRRCHDLVLVSTRGCCGVA